jgi:hypothetical protein
VPAWTGEAVDEVARPCEAKTLAVLALVDGQIFIEEAMVKLRARDVEAAIRCLRLARESQRQATGIIDRMKEKVG